ncbi:MAG: hypothetical protein H0U60_05280 [Blastocatellia bacterium]|nr:hypothetical protein [Blastocatellia bacterium]
MSASMRKNVLAEINSSSGYSGIEEHSAPLHSFLEYATSLIFPILFVLNVHWAGSLLYELDLLWLIGLAIPLGVLGGDLVSGIVHWAADTYCSVDTPVVGPSLVKPFRMHHVYPRDICTHNLVETVGNVCILAFPLLSLCLFLMWLIPESGLLAFVVICVALTSAATVATNQFHKWAHQEKVSGFARRLQRMRLVLEPTHHKLHHTDPFNMHYCITNGWLNPLLNKIKFFRRLEATLAFFGIRTANSVNSTQHRQ